MSLFLFVDFWMKGAAGIAAWGVAVLAVVGLFSASRNVNRGHCSPENAIQMWLSVIAAAAVAGLLLALSAT